MCHPWPCHDDPGDVHNVPAVRIARVRARGSIRARASVYKQQSSTQEVTKDDVRAHTDRYARA